jgi:fatty-acid desaturase
MLLVHNSTFRETAASGLARERAFPGTKSFDHFYTTYVKTPKFIVTNLQETSSNAIPKTCIILYCIVFNYIYTLPGNLSIDIDFHRAV